MKGPVLLDTQLMVLLVVGITSSLIIPKHKNLTEFGTDDFELLLMLLGSDPELILLPNIVSEAANLLRHHRDPERSAILLSLKLLVHQNCERYVPTSTVVDRSEYMRLGVTDTAILETCKNSDCEILTSDAALFIAASTGGFRATNFNHKREDFGLL